MGRKFPQERPIRRKTGIQNPKLCLVVVCEGEITEPDYLRKFANDHGSGLVQLIAIPKGGAPVTLVDKAIEEKRKLVWAARRSKNSFDAQFQVWGVFDIDEHPNIGQAKDKAYGNGIKLAISNPCIELWALLHMQDHGAPIHRHELQRLLSNIMDGYHHGRSPIFNYQIMKLRYQKAKDRAESMRARRTEEGDSGGNPCTNIDELLDVIILNGRKGSQRSPDETK